MAIWHIPRAPFSDDTQEEVESFDPTLWEAGEEPQVMGAKTRRMDPPPLPTHPNAPCAYSPRCVESKFCELLRIETEFYEIQQSFRTRTYGRVLRGSSIFLRILRFEVYF